MYHVSLFVLLISVHVASAGLGLGFGNVSAPLKSRPGSENSGNNFPFSGNLTFGRKLNKQENDNQSADFDAQNHFVKREVSSEESTTENHFIEKRDIKIVSILNSTLPSINVLNTTISLVKPVMGAPMVAFINSKVKKFTAQRYERFENLTRDQLKSFLGAHKDVNIEKRKKRATNTTTNNSTLPLNFDISTKWPQCKSVFEGIQDQSQCGSCWAVSTAAVISDRRCIMWNGTAKPRISAWDLVSCCSTCRANSNGCNGGYPTAAFSWYAKTGVVSGGGYQGPGCKPYLVSPYATKAPTTTACSTTCQSKYKKATYAKDKKKGSAYKVFSNQNDAVMAEIQARGSVVAVFDVYEDFYQYSTGVYQHVTGDYLGGHAVKIVGWGQTSDGTKYWRAANSWANSWGENGFFRILRGTNDCGFEEGIVAAPALKD